MASGRLGAADLAAATLTTIYTVPASKLTTCSVNICNRNSVPVRIRLAFAAATTPTGAEWVEYDAVIDPTNTIERTGIVLDATKNIVAYSDYANVSVVAYGFEE